MELQLGWIISIVGSILALALLLNGYLIKEMLDSLNQLKLQTAILIENGTNKEQRLAKTEREIEEFRKRMHNIITTQIELRFMIDNGPKA